MKNKIILFLACIPITFFGSLKNLWEKTEMIWNFGIISSCDLGLEASPFRFFERNEDEFNPQNYINIQSGDIVWVKCRWLPKFYNQVFPHVTNPFVLVISD